MFNIVNTLTGNIEATRKTRSAADKKAKQLNGGETLRVTTLNMYVVRKG